MKFISVRELRSKTSSVWKNLKRDQELVLTSNGKPIALVTAVGEDDLQASLDSLRQARALSAVERMQENSLRAGLDKLTLKQINAIIQETRKGYSR